MVSNEARDRLFGAEPPALDLTDASFATQGRFNQAAQDFLLFRWDGLNATPCNELYLLHSIAASIYIGDKRGVFQCRQGTVNDYPVDDPGSSDDSKLRPPKYVISVLMTPEVFLDEERRLVAGSFTTMEGSAVVGSSMEGAKVEYHGRFVINLDNPGEILAAQKVQGEKEEATVIILSYPVRAYGLGGAKMWAVRGDDGGIRQGNWPSQGMSIAHFRPCCPFCTASGILCQCPDSMLNRYFPLSQRRFAGWDEMRHFLSFQNVSHTIVTSLTLEKPGEDSIFIGSSPDLITNGREAPFFVEKVTAAYLRYRFPSIPSREPLDFFLNDRNRLETPGLQGMSGLEPRDSKTNYSFPCRCCARIFTRPGRRDEHEAIVHEGKSLYSCPTCDRSFPTSGNLGRHIRMVHEQVKRFFCSDCPMAFYSARDYARHRSRNHGEFEKIPRIE